MSSCSLFLLGPVQLFLDGRPLSFRTNKALALLCYLAVEAGERPDVAHRREALMELLWPEMPLKAAQDNLRQTLYQVRKGVPEAAGKEGAEAQPFILADRLAVEVNPACAYELDVAAFQKLVAAGAVPAGLEEAMTLYRGDFLADFYLPDSNVFEEWAAGWRLRLRLQALEALERLATHFAEQGAWAEAEKYARRQLELDNLRENAHRLLMRILTESGRRHLALQQYESCRLLLRDELGVEPAAETVALYERLRAAGKSAVHHNLPAPTTSFVGREKETGVAIRLLKDPTVRLLTLAGPGGIGKTRLALQVALHLAEQEHGHFPHGVYFVPLAAVPTLEHLVPAVAGAIGFSFSGTREPRKQLLAFLQTKEMLLVLDNLEHLVDEAALLVEFLAAAPGLAFLVTSRARLNLYEEWCLELQGLETPAGEAMGGLESYSAIQLFVQRARQARLDFAPEPNLPAIWEICELLGRMPLAIELAAGWVRTHTCRQISAEIQRGLDFLTTTIQNVPQRHRSLHVTFEHSWRLLPAACQEAFARVTVFRGSFDQDAAQFVAGASPAVLAALVGHSMLQSTAGRFQINELLRQFGAEKLEESVAAGVRQRHAAYYGGYLQQRQQRRWTAHEPAALEEINAELQNIQAGWQWIIAHLDDSDQAVQSLELAGRYMPMLAYFFDQMSRFHEGVALFQQAALRMEAVWPDAGEVTELGHERQVMLAQARANEAALRFHLSQFGEVEALLQQSLTAFRRAGHRPQMARTLVRLGMTCNRLGVYEDANRYLQESLALYRETGERAASAEALNGLGVVAISEERFEEGRELLQEALAIYRERGYQRGIARLLSNLGTADVRSGRYDEARLLYNEALAAARTIADRMVVAVVLSNLGSIARVLAQYENAMHYYKESLATFREMDERRWIAVCLNGLGETLLDMEQLELAEQHLRQALELSLALQSIPDVLDSVAALAEIAGRSGQREAATAALGFVVHHAVSKPLARERSERVLAELKREMEVEAWEQARQRGTAEMLETLVAELGYQRSVLTKIG